MDKLLRYTTLGSKICVAYIYDTIKQTEKAHCIDTAKECELAYVECIAACLCAWRKEDNASVAVSVKYPEKKMNFSAIAEKDGRVRGCIESFQTGIIKTGVIMEITQKLSVRGDYTSIITAENITAAVEEYYKSSQQITAYCNIIKYPETYCCILEEQFPVTEPEHEKYIKDASDVSEKITCALNNKKIHDLENVLKTFNFLEEKEIVYGCTCTLESVKKSITGIPQNELKLIADKDNIIEITCKYCGKKYRISI